MKRKQKKLLTFTNFVKRFFVFSASQGTVSYFQSKQDDRSTPSDVIQLSEVQAVKREGEGMISHDDMMLTQ